MTGRMQLLRRYATRLGVSTTRIVVTARAGVVHAAVSAHPDFLSMVDGARRAFGWNVLGARPATSFARAWRGSARPAHPSPRGRTHAA